MQCWSSQTFFHMHNNNPHSRLCSFFFNWFSFIHKFHRTILLKFPIQNTAYRITTTENSNHNIHYDNEELATAVYNGKTHQSLLYCSNVFAGPKLEMNLKWKLLGKNRSYTRMCSSHLFIELWLTLDWIDTQRQMTSQQLKRSMRSANVHSSAPWQHHTPDNDNDIVQHNASSLFWLYFGSFWNRMKW